MLKIKKWVINPFITDASSKFQDQNEFSMGIKKSRWVYKNAFPKEILINSTYFMLKICELQCQSLSRKKRLKGNVSNVLYINVTQVSG